MGKNQGCIGDVQNKLKHWKIFRKEISAAILGAMIYYIWKARNWKQFKGVFTDYTENIGRIKRDIVGRIDLYKHTKKAQRCRSFWQVLCN